MVFLFFGVFVVSFCSSGFVCGRSLLRVPVRSPRCVRLSVLFPWVFVAFFPSVSGRCCFGSFSRGCFRFQWRGAAFLPCFSRFQVCFGSCCSSPVVRWGPGCGVLSLRFPFLPPVWRVGGRGFGCSVRCPRGCCGALTRAGCFCSFFRFFPASAVCFWPGGVGSCSLSSLSVLSLPPSCLSFWAGGGASVPLRGRLSRRSQAVVFSSVCLVAFLRCGACGSCGSCRVVAFALSRSRPVVVFPCGCPPPPGWVPVSSFLGVSFPSGGFVPPPAGQISLL